MSTPKNMKGKLSNDEIWQERLGQINGRTIDRLAAKGKKVPEQIPPVMPVTVATVDPLACGEDCPICHGEGFTIDHTESAQPCPRYEERRRNARKAAGDD